MSTMQKLFMGSASSRPCNSCGREVTIPGKYYVLMIVALGLLFLGSQMVKLETIQILIIGLVIAIVFSLIQIYIVPISKNKFDELR